MSWSIHYSAKMDENLSSTDFENLKDLNKPTLSKNCGELIWTKIGFANYTGFCKIELSDKPESDYQLIVKYLQKLEESAPNYEIRFSDDYYIENESPSSITSFSFLSETSDTSPSNSNNKTNIDTVVQDARDFAQLKANFMDYIPFIDEHDKFGDTLLTASIKAGNFGTVWNALQFLNADISVPDASGNSPEDLAINCENENISQLIKLKLSDDLLGMYDLFSKVTGC